MRGNLRAAPANLTGTTTPESAVFDPADLELGRVYIQTGGSTVVYWRRNGEVWSPDPVVLSGSTDPNLTVPATVTVSDTLNSGAAPVVFPPLLYAGLRSGKPAWSETGSQEVPAYLLSWFDDNWVLGAPDAVWVVLSDAASPMDLDWSDSGFGGAIGTPVLTGEGSVEIAGISATAGQIYNQIDEEGALVAVFVSKGDGVWRRLLIEDIPLTVVAPSSPYELPAPVGTFEAGTTARFHITPTADQDFTLSEGILIPSDSAVVFPKTLKDGKLYIVQLTYSGSSWLLTSLVGGYG